MDRRTFLRALGFGTVAAAAAATSAFDVERLLWVPGEKTIILPPPANLAFRKDAFELVWSDQDRAAWRNVTILSMERGTELFVCSGGHGYIISDPTPAQVRALGESVDDLARAIDREGLRRYYKDMASYERMG